MQITLRRRPSGDRATIGELFVDGNFSCYTLEDVVREEPGVRIAAWKIPGETAIPAGRYRVTITQSARFKRELPLLNMVPGFEGVRIHPGNTDEDTEGCILPGTRVVGETVVESRAAFQRLFDAIDGELNAGDEVWIEIRNAERQEMA